MTDDKHDVVVIGSGAGGGASAWALSQRGLSVLLLEAGPRYDPARDYRLASDAWEQSRFPHKLKTRRRQSFAPLQRLDSKHRQLRSWNHLTGLMVAGDRRAAWGYHHVVGVGGSTLHYTGEAHRLNPKALRMRSRFGVAADWPLDYDDLEPFYVQAERVTGVAGPAGETTRPRSSPYPLPPHRFSYASKKIQDGCKNLGLSWVPNSVASLSAPYDGRPGCNYCGQCARGCPRFDKGTVDITFIRKAQASGKCEVRTGCRVTRLETGAGDRVRRVHYLDVNGAARVVEGRAVVVACGAVETPRLLLNSMGEQAPDGLANESGHVGKHFMETLAWVSSAVHPERIGSHRGLPSDGICWDYNAPDAVPGVAGGCRFSPGTLESDLSGPINYARRVVGGWGKDHKARMRATFGRVLSVASIGESLPNARTFIDLDPHRKDDAGLPVARINAYLENTEIDRLRFMAKTCREILAATGAGKVFEEYGSYDAFNATHVFGTCRMGRDPQDSVVDAYGRSHRWKNLFVADASVFPSSGGGEAPSLTIEALAIRTAEHIAALAGMREL